MPNVLNFTKMHGIGNDYVYFNCVTSNHNSGLTEDILSDNNALSRLSILLSDRHTGIGGDGIILILPSEIADFRMRIFNADGSEAKMCGNGTRCVGKYVYDHGLTDKKTITLETLSGVKILRLQTDQSNKVASVTVDMGPAEFVPERIPVNAPGKADGFNLSAEVNGTAYTINAISMGNPHGVIFLQEITDKIVLCDGPGLERHEMWPDRANIEFAVVTSQHDVDVRVWERGSGETMACGTGACATAVAAVSNGLCQWPVNVKLRGGILKISQDTDTGYILMEGTASEVFDGTMQMLEL